MSTVVSRRITWIKSILCVLVIYVHCRNTDWFQTGTAINIAAAEELLCDIFAKIAVPGFFFFSGYLFFCGYRPEKLLTKWKSRIFTLVIPFVLWNLIYYVIEILLRILPFTAGAFAGTTVPVNVKEILLAAFNCKYQPVFWFLQYLIIYTLLAPLFWRLLKNRTIGAVILGAVFAAALILSNVTLPGWMRTGLLLLQYSPAYLTGCYAALHLREFFEDKPVTWEKALPAGLIFTALIVWEILAPSLYSIELIRLITGTLLWFFLGVIPFGEPRRWMRFSFYLYAAHGMIAKLVNMTICIKVSSSMVTGGIVFLILPWFIILFCTLTGRLMERFLMHVSYLLGISKKTGKKV